MGASSSAPTGTRAVSTDATDNLRVTQYTMVAGCPDPIVEWSHLECGEHQRKLWEARAARIKAIAGGFRKKPRLRWDWERGMWCEWDTGWQKWVPSWRAYLKHDHKT